jgi:hypothetical protein
MTCWTAACTLSTAVLLVWRLAKDGRKCSRPKLDDLFALPNGVSSSLRGVLESCVVVVVVIVVVVVTVENRLVRALLLSSGVSNKDGPSLLRSVFLSTVRRVDKILGLDAGEQLRDGIKRGMVVE